MSRLPNIIPFITKKVYEELVNKSVVNRIDGFVGIRFGNQYRDFDFTGGNHADIDIGIIQRFKHFGCNTGVALHTGTHDADLGNVCIHNHACAAKTGKVLFQNHFCGGGILERHCENQG